MKYTQKLTTTKTDNGTSSGDKNDVEWVSQIEREGNRENAEKANHY